MPDPLRPQSPRVKESLLYLGLAFIATRLVLDAKALFYYDAVNLYMQYLDPQILRDNLWRGVWYLHIQPPLYNLFLGSVLQLKSQSAQALVFSSLYCLMGLLIVLGSYLLMRKLGVSNRLALIVSCCLIVFPPLLQAERTLDYECPVEALTVCAALLLYRLEARKQYRYFVWFMLTLTVIVLSRSLYHLLAWFLPLAILSLLWAYAHGLCKRNRYVAAAIVSFLLGSTIYIKNYVSYGIFSSSTWQGLNFIEMTRYVPEAIKLRMVQRGQLTPLAIRDNVLAPSDYFSYYRIAPRVANPAIANVYKSTGEINYNHYVYAIASREQQHNAIVMILYHPLYYLEAVANETYIFFSFMPYRYFPDWRSWMIPRTDAARHFVLDVALVYGVPAFLLTIFWLALYGLLEPFWIRGFRWKRLIEKEAALPMLRCFMVFNILYVAAIGNLCEIKEGCFYRMPIDPLLFIGAGVAIQMLLKRRRGEEAA